MRTHTPAAVVAVAVLLLAGCSSGGDDSTAKPSAKTTASSSPSATAAASVKLSTTWTPKLEALTGGTGVGACSADSGSADCTQAISDSVDLLTQITDAIGTAGAADDYPLTVAEITKLVGDADDYAKGECPGDGNADVNGSPCPKAAIAVTVGMAGLEMVMQTDELNAGVA